MKYKCHVCVKRSGRMEKNPKERPSAARNPLRFFGLISSRAERAIIMDDDLDSPCVYEPRLSLRVDFHITEL